MTLNEYKQGVKNFYVSSLLDLHVFRTVQFATQ